MMFSLFRRKSISFCLSCFTVGVLGVNLASAQTVGPGCDPAFMKAIQDKAWVEAQREIMIAQTQIAKPDSVFSLGCFDDWTSGFNINFGNGNDYNYSSNISNYLGQAFGHVHGGGHYSGSGSNSSGTSCSMMADLWDNARGSELDSPSRMLDTLQDIATYDRGSFPNTASAPGGFTNPLKRFFDPKVANQSIGTTFDDMNLFAAVTLPQSQLAAPKKCAKGIPTGVSIDVSGGPRPEIVCPNPGCISDGAAAPKCCDYAGTATTCN